MKSTIHLCGQPYTVSVEREGANGRIRYFIGDEEASQFIERMSLLGRHDIIEDLARIGEAKLRGTLTLGSAQETAWSLHQKRARNN